MRQGHWYIPFDPLPLFHPKPSLHLVSGFKIFYLVWVAVPGAGIAVGMAFVPSLPALLHATRTLVRHPLFFLSLVFDPRNHLSTHEDLDVLAGVHCPSSSGAWSGQDLCALAGRAPACHLDPISTSSLPFSLVQSKIHLSTHGGLRCTGWRAFP